MDKQLLYKFFEGKTSVTEEACIKEWMEASPVHQKELFDERKLYDAMVLLARDAGQQPEKKKTIRRILPYLYEVGKIAAVIFLTFQVVRYLYVKEEYPGLDMQTVEVPAGQRINLNLPDGTNVWLNARTSLRYPVDFGQKERVIELDGEAYFEVPPRNNQPFTVRTPQGEVEVLGTKFNVEAYSYKGDFETTLMEGRVKVLLAAAAEEEYFLRPGQKITLENGEMILSQVEDYNHYRWKEGLICFRNDTFEEMMISFEKYYEKKIIVRNPALLQYQYTGKFRQTDGIDYALRILQRDLRFTYERDDDDQIIYID